MNSGPLGWNLSYTAHRCILCQLLTEGKELVNSSLRFVESRTPISDIVFNAW